MQHRYNIGTTIKKRNEIERNGLPNLVTILALWVVEISKENKYLFNIEKTGSFYPARALRALGLLLADGAPTVGGGKTF